MECACARLVKRDASGFTVVLSCMKGENEIEEHFERLRRKEEEEEE